MEQPLATVIKQQSSGLVRVTKTANRPLRLTAIVVGLFLTMMPLLTGCAPEQQTGSGSTATPAAATASLQWDPVQDPSVIGYFVHYGRQSPGQPASCTYESSMYVDSPSATVESLDPNTLYYFTVSAYNGLESPCSEEVSTVTAPPPASTGQGIPLA
jgi:Fibronectin type III domain